MSAVPTTAIMAPGERIKVLLVAGRKECGQAFSGPRDVVSHLLRSQGWAAGLQSLFRGTTVTLLRDSVGSFAYFAAYEGIKRRFLSSDSSSGGSSSSGSGSSGAAAAAAAAAQGPSTVAIIAGGAAAGFANWLVALPFDTVKSRIQASMATSAAGGGKLPGMLAVTRALVQAEGLGGLYKGLGPAIARAVPANISCFLGVEWSKAALDKVM
jgi:solute carrier family 25 carnitine/acylcarnitine transporter 20/29